MSGESKKVSMYHLTKMIAEKDTSGMQKTPYVINGYHVMVKQTIHQFTLFYANFFIAVNGFPAHIS